MTHLLAADIGGTKTLLQLSTLEGELVRQQRFDSQRFSGFEHLLSSFLADNTHSIAAACFAVAGPVSGRTAKVTNLPWKLDADELATMFALRQVQLCNDFAAVGYGIEALADDDLLTLQTGEEGGSGPRAIIGAGTGLGQAVMVQQADGWQVLPTEGGHVDFAPTDRTQVLLLEHLFERFGHVSYERLLSGDGLVTIYHFLRDYRQQAENPELRMAMVNDDAAAAISLYALEHQDPLAVEAVDLFFAIYGAQAGNLALSVLPTQGLYIAGGIAGKNLQKFSEAGFMQAFLAKGRMRGLLEKIPVHVVLHAEVGLLGARLLAQKAAYN